MTSYAHDTPDLAATYDRVSDSQFEGGKALLGQLKLCPGDRVLDVGCGTGRLSRWIADTVKPDGGVVGIDPLPDRVALARAHHPDLRFEAGVAEDLGMFPNEGFDIVCLSAVFHWIADKPTALAECFRVLKHGGRVGFTTSPKELHRVGTIAQVCTSVLGRSPYRENLDLGPLSALAQGTTLTEMVTMILESGLELTALHLVERTHARPSGAAIVDYAESSTFGNFLRTVPESMRKALRDDLAAAFDARKEGDCIPIRAHGVLALARRP